MSYKVKSLIYFVCFLASAIMYYSMEQDFPLDGDTQAVELAEVDLNELPATTEETAVRLP